MTNQTFTLVINNTTLDAFPLVEGTQLEQDDLQFANPQELKESSFSMTEITAMANAISPKEIKRFSTKGKAAEKLFALVQQKYGVNMDTEELDNPEQEEEQTQPESVPSVQKRRGYSRDAIITWHVETNPKREGSKSHERAAQFWGLRTVGECLDNGASRGDLNWSIDRGEITITEPGTEE